MEGKKLVTKKNDIEPAVYAGEQDPWEDAERPVVHAGKPDRDGAVVTLKAGAGYDAPWIVLHATSVDDAISQLNGDEFTELMDLAARKGKEFAKLFGGAQSFAKPAGNTGWSKPAQAASQASSDVPTGTCPQHNCDLVYVEPFKKRDGSEVSARVACPVPKCYAKTFWHNKDGSWTEK